MPLPLYLAMTAAEISCAPALPASCAYMACHFSPYSTGLSNFPQALPPDSVLILNDRTPVQGHDPDLIAAQLAQCAEQWHVSAVLLDFQRPDDPQTAAISQAVVSALSCAVGISECYAADLTCPVFLSPPPLDRTLSAHISPWLGRELWLDAAMNTQLITVTPTGSQTTHGTLYEQADCPHSDPVLHIHYKIKVSPDQVCFTLHRTWEDLTALLQEAEALGITRAIGLYQELRSQS